MKVENALPKYLYETNAMRVRGLLLLSGINTKDMAAKAGVSSGYISSVLNGSRLGLKLRFAIADALRMPYKEVWQDDPPERKGVK